jgi:hypothetical protein
MLLVALVGGCGSPTADVDAGGQDATVDGAVDACEGFGCTDAFTQPDALPVTQVVCPDAGYYITVNGDGVMKTLSSSFAGVPVAEFLDCCGSTTFRIVASESPDAGASVQLTQPAFENNVDGGVTFGPSTNDVYFRADGTPFASFYVPDASAVNTYTHVDPPGGIVSGSYVATVATSLKPDAATLSISGTFLACRVSDAYCGCPPPPGP